MTKQRQVHGLIILSDANPEPKQSSSVLAMMCRLAHRLKRTRKAWLKLSFRCNA